MCVHFAYTLGLLRVSLYVYIRFGRLSPRYNGSLEKKGEEQRGANGECAAQQQLSGKVDQTCKTAGERERRALL